MNTIKEICVITNLYPPFPSKTSGMFLYNLLAAFSNEGVRCTVIRPVSITKGLLRRRHLPPPQIAENLGDATITVYSPRYISFGDRTPLLYSLSYLMKETAAVRAFKKMGKNLDALYAHFLTSGRTALVLGRKYKLPVFVAHGESDFSVQFSRMAQKERQNFYNDISGVVAVSSHIKRHILEYVSIDQEKIIVEPNGVHTSIFQPMDKYETRRRLGIPEELIVVVFVGTMIERKGPRRLAQALEGLDSIHGYFVGKGRASIPDANDNIHVCGEKEQLDVVDYLNAADMFVLPTLAEGSSNVIVEALACGLPVISSDRDFNEDILDDSCSLLVEPTDINQIREAILILANNKELRNQKAQAAVEKAKQLDIMERAKRILSFMEQHI